MTIQFFVHGEPRGQPRPRAFARKFGNKYSARVYNPATAEGWKSQIAMAAKPYVPVTPLEGPLSVDLTFMLPRPKSHFRTGKHTEDLRSDAPTYHTSKPDSDNLSKAAYDCLTAIGFWRDDAQVCVGKTTKLYTDKVPGCLIKVGRVGG
jgi:Holliday junction resolvase RusA-like endonuclease